MTIPGYVPRIGERDLDKIISSIRHLYENIKFATAAEAQAKSDSGVVLTPSNLAALDASDTFAGFVELATVAETRTGIDTARAVTPDGLEAFTGPRFFATRSSAETLTADTWTKISVNTEVIDTDGCYDPTTNFRFTPTVSGYYFTFAGCSPNCTNGEIGGVAIYKNGSGYQYSTSIPGADGAINSFVISLISMNGTTDYLELYGYASNNASPTVTLSFFGGYRLSP